MPRSRATWATGLPVSRTIRTAPARNSGSNRLRFSAMTLYPLRSGLHAIGGTSGALLARLDERHERSQPYAGRFERVANPSGQIDRARGVAVQAERFDRVRQHRSVLGLDLAA